MKTIQRFKTGSIGCFLAFITLFILGSSAVHAALPNVKNETTGAQYTDLQVAINDASSNDTLRLKGKFIGSFSITKSLTLNGGSNAVLDGVNTFRVLAILQTSLSETILVTLENLTIQNGSSDYGAGIYNTANLTLKNVVVVKNSAIDQGGGIFNSTSGLLTTGPGILNIYNSYIGKNTAGELGGGLVNNGGIVTIDNTKINKNTAAGGGGIYSIGGTNTITDSKIENNIASEGTQEDHIIGAGFGGGLYNALSSITTLEHVKVDSNTANYGGGIYNANSVLTINNSKLHENLAFFEGGGLFNESLQTASLHHSKVTDNKATNGGGIFCGDILTDDDPPLILDDTIVEENTPNDVVIFTSNLL